MPVYAIRLKTTAADRYVGRDLKFVEGPSAAVKFSTPADACHWFATIRGVRPPDDPFASHTDFGYELVRVAEGDHYPDPARETVRAYARDLSDRELMSLALDILPDSPARLELVALCEGIRAWWADLAVAASMQPDGTPLRILHDLNRSTARADA